MPLKSVVLLLLLLVVGCGGPMGRAVHHYESTRYPEALDSFRRLEADAADYDPPQRARYSLYRGLAHLAVGDAPKASVWLGRAREEVLEDPERLSDVDQSRLASAWRSLGLMPGDDVVTR